MTVVMVTAVLHRIPLRVIAHLPAFCNLVRMSWILHWCY